MTFIAKLGLKFPVLLAPIGSPASVELAAAVSNAGGMGSFALTWTEPLIAAKRVAELRSKTVRPFFVNFALAFKPTALIPALESGAPVVTFSWGLPGALVETVHSFGALVGVQIATVQGALQAIEQGCDFLICQGVEAGGHVQSSVPLPELLTSVRAVAGRTPLAAAGGIVNHDDVAELRRLGADAVMLGTRFLACRESLAHPAYKSALIKAQRSDTVLTGCFEKGWPYALHRVLRNSTLTNWEAAGCPPVGKRPGEGDVVAQYHERRILRYEVSPPVSEMTGDVLSCALYAGSGVEKITAIRPAADIVQDLWKA